MHSLYVGDRPYIAEEDNETREVRRERIRAAIQREWNGRNRWELCGCYGISRAIFWRINSGDS